MELSNLIHIMAFILFSSLIFYGMHRISKYAFSSNVILLFLWIAWWYSSKNLVEAFLYLGCPLLLINTVFYVFMDKKDEKQSLKKKYQVNFKTTNSDFKIDNIKRGASIIGSAGSGKTESVVYGFLKHFQKYNFCGVIHDYKDFELTEMTYPLFKNSENQFYIISFDKIIHRVNPIAPRYLENEESVNDEI